MDLELTDRVYLVTGGARGLGRATATRLVAEGARVVLSGRTRGVARRRGRPSSATPAVTVGRRQRRPGHAGRLIAAARERWGRLDGALISVGGPPTGPVTDDHRRAVDGGVRVGVPRRGPAGPRDRRGAAATAARSRSCSPRACGHRSPGWRSPTGCGPGWRWSPRPSPTSSARAASASTGCCRAGSAPTGSPSSTRRPATPAAARGGAIADDPAGPLRRAGGVRPGRGLPAVAGGVVRHRRRCCRSTAGMLRAL